MSTVVAIGIMPVGIGLSRTVSPASVSRGLPIASRWAVDARRVYGREQAALAAPAGERRDRGRQARHFAREGSEGSEGTFEGVTDGPADRVAYSITSSARARSDSGTVMPKLLAVFKLMNSSSLVTRCTGRSEGFSPLSTRPV